jgi:hypothetical protein
VGLPQSCPPQGKNGNFGCDLLLGQDLKPEMGLWSVTLRAMRKPVSRRSLKKAIDALTILNRHFGRETQSAALGEVSESLIAAYVGAERRERNSKGHDLYKDGHLIEVKSRLIDNWQDDNQFNFSKHTARARTAYCVAWRIDESNRPVLQHVFEVGVPFLVERWATPKQPTYCARTTLRRLKAARQTFSCSSGSS